MRSFTVDLHAPPPQPFTVRHQLKASLRRDGRCIDSIEVILDLDELGATAPHGFVLGNNLTVQAIETALADGYGLPECDLVADGLTAKIAVTRSTKRGSGEGPTGVVMSFRASQVDVTETIHDWAPTTRDVLFFLAGPEAHWGGGHSREVSFDGTASVKAFGTAFELDEALPFALEILPHFVYARTAKDRQETVAQVTVVKASWRGSEDFVSDDEFAKQAEEVVNDCSLLVSFLSRTTVGWYRYTLAGSTGLVHRHRPSPVLPDSFFDFHDLPVAFGDRREFLRLAVPRLRHLRKQEQAPELAIRHTLAACSATTLEERFVNYFFALESLRDSQSHRSGELIMGGSPFAKVRKVLIAALREARASLKNPPDDSQMIAIAEKMPELNRRTFAASLDAMLERHGAKWTDLYPPGQTPKQPRFIGLRNELLHTGRVSSSEALRYETLRLQGVVERLILRILGWDDISHAPPPRFRAALLLNLGGVHEPSPSVGDADSEECS